MKTKKVFRHFCDHCSKGMLQIPAMQRHEAVCFKNPKRSCPICFNAKEFSVSFDWRIYGNGVETRASECPACLLPAVIRHNTKLDEEDRNCWVNYSKEQYKEDMRAFKSEQSFDLSGLFL